MHLSADGRGQTEGEVRTKSGARQTKEKRVRLFLQVLVFCVFFLTV